MKIWKSTLIILAIIISAASYGYAHIIRLILIDYSSFHEISDNIYLSDTLPASAKLEVETLLAKARDRITAHYGKPYATPVIVIPGNEEERRRYGLNDFPGTLLFAPWRSYLLLQHPLDINVVAHELVHAEIVHRVGYLKRQSDIPTWFDEGSAMQVDYREKYSTHQPVNQAEFLRLTSLDTPSEFWSHDKEQTIKNYQGVKTVVSQLFSPPDNELYEILSRIQDGEEGVVNTITRNTEWTSR